jgi:prepilin-type N-terminal cleavage/methylation domain-containing protein
VQGLTLVELMVVLAVMGVLVSAALPSMSQGFADRKVAMVARDVVALFRRARYMSMAYGRAHQVVYANDSGTGLTDEPWAFETLRGIAGACSLNDGTGDAFELSQLNCGANPRCTDFLYANTYDSDPGDTDLVRVDGWDESSFCYEAGSNNQVFIDTALFSNWQTGVARAGFGFVVYRERDGNPFGVARKVLIPMGTGTPRVLQ